MKNEYIIEYTPENPVPPGVKYMIGVYNEFTCLNENDLKIEREKHFSILKRHTNALTIIKIYRVR